jgi:beta-lactamase regulating signal transducer with metallopeptidase domain
MEIKAKYLVIWLVLLIIGVAMIVGPVVARNFTSVDSPKPKNMDKGIKIDKIDKDKKDKDPIKIKSHPVLKSPQSTAITTLSWGPYSQKA